MKIQSLAIIFIIIILPISLVLSSYTQSRVQTLSIQAEYDSKLNDSTFDALKAYQLNSFSTAGTENYTNSKIKDIEASVNTFFNSMSSNFSTLGYTKNTLQNFVPALVYTMYDGYYIYAPYTNTWYNDENSKIAEEVKKQIPTQNTETYENGQLLYGLKPYVYYSARYKKGGIDVTITYSLDNYIQIQGTIDGGTTTVSKYGYLLDKDSVDESGTQYKDVSISKDIIPEKIYIEGSDYPQEYLCIKENGTKYYFDGEKVFSVVNGKKIPQPESYGRKLFGEDRNTNSNAQKYYKEAYELKKFFDDNVKLKDLTVNDIVNPTTGKTYAKEGSKNPYTDVGQIFDFSDIESETSNFNTHRIDVIKNSIETNLSVVIENFNKFSGAGTSIDFRMPKLKESDWDTIMENISIISFMQGVNIGGKVYNGYSIISNNKNEDIVMPDSIYIKDVNNPRTIHRITEEGLTYQDGMQGIYNVNLERRSGEDSQGKISYYFPIDGELSYNSIITQNGISDKYRGNLNDYIEKLDPKLQSIYYTALARERYGLYRQKLEIDPSKE